MKLTTTKHAGRRILGVLVALAVFAAPVLIGNGESIAQVKDWEKIKFPTLRPFKIAEPVRFEMANGITVLMVEDNELPLIRLRARVQVGSRLEAADKVGLASITGDVLRTGGSGNRTGDEIDDWLDARGAEIETSISTTSGMHSISCLKEDFPKVLKLFSEVMRNPRFDEKKIKVSKTQIKSGIARRNDSQQGIMRREAMRLIYGEESPYARNAEYDTIDSISQIDMRKFHEKYYVPNRTFIGVVGDFKTAEMKQMLTEVFGDWKRGPEMKDPEFSIRQAAAPGIYHIEKTDVTQSAVMMGHLGIRQDSPDYFAAEVMNQILSGSFAARLFNNIRTEKGLAYSVRGNLGAHFDYPGTFSMWLTTKTETTAAAMDALLVELDALVASQPTSEEMERSKDSMINSFIFNYDTPWKIMNQQLALAFYGYPSDFLTQYRTNIEKVTAADVLRVARKHVRRDDIAIVVVGPTEGLDRSLASFGDLKDLDITIPEPSAVPQAIAAVPGMSEEETLARGKETFIKMMNATGGETAIDGVKSLRVTGKMTMKTPQGEMEMGGTRTYLLPDHMRQELQTPMGSITMVASPADGFMSMGGNIRELPGSQRDEMLKSIRRLQLTVLQARNDQGFSARYGGTESVSGTECEIVGVTLGGDQGGGMTVYAVNKENGQVVRSSYHGQGPQGIPGQVVTFFSDYRNADGLMFAFKARQLFEGEQTSTLSAEEIAVNEQVDEAQFKRPAGSGETEPAGGK